MAAYVRKEDKLQIIDKMIEQLRLARDQVETAHRMKKFPAELTEVYYTLHEMYEEELI